MAGTIALVSEHASPAALLGGQDAGGQNVYVDEISRHLARLGWPVDVFTRRDSPRLPDVVAWAPGVRIINLPAGPPVMLDKDELWPLMPAFRDAMQAFIARERQQYDALHGNFWMSGWVVAELRRRLGIPAVQLFHALGATKRCEQGAADTSPDSRTAVERSIVRTVDRVLVQCPSERDELVSVYGAEPSRLALVSSGVDLDRFRPCARRDARRRVGVAHDSFVITYVGRLVARKDVANILRAAALLGRRTATAVEVLVVGGPSSDPASLDVPELAALRELAAQLGIADRVRLIGNRQRDQLRDFYCAGDVAVTTPWYEPFGFTPLEAMACGRPVIGSQVGGIGYTVRDGRTGFLVPPRDPEALAQRLHWLQAAPQLAEQLGRNARAHVERRFSWHGTARRTAAVYRALPRQPVRRHAERTRAQRSMLGAER